jgi:predicted TIM-barrel fold metal-dependent hydrolase
MIDMHVHYFPPRVFEAIWAYFERHGLWPIHYKLHGREHVATLRAHGVERFTTLVYAHKAGMADFLNEFVREAWAEEPAMIPFGTIFAGDGEIERRALRIFDEYGFRGVKLHPFVSGDAIDDPRMFALYEVMEARDRILLCHPGSGPVYAETDGAERLRKVLTAFPRLKVIVAHCGAFEYGDYHALADAFPTVHFDTAMNCVHTHVFDRNCPGRAFFERFADRIVFGSDFPNIPYAYSEQIDAIKGLRLGEEAERAVFRGNALRLLGQSPNRPVV